MFLRLFILACLSSSACQALQPPYDHNPRRIEQIGGYEIVTFGDDRTLRWWDILKEKEIRRVEIAPPLEMSISRWNPRDMSKKILATANKYDTIIIWTEDGEKLRTLKHEGVLCLSIFDDERDEDGYSRLRLASAGTDKKIVIWDPLTGERLKEYEADDRIDALIVHDRHEWPESGTAYPIAAALLSHNRKSNNHSRLQLIDLEDGSKSTPIPSRHNALTAEKRFLKFEESGRIHYFSSRQEIRSELLRPTIAAKPVLEQTDRQESARIWESPFFNRMRVFDFESRKGKFGDERTFAIGGQQFAAIVTNGKVSNMRRVKGHVRDIQILSSFRIGFAVALCYANRIEIWKPAGEDQEEYVLTLIPEKKEITSLSQPHLARSSALPQPSPAISESGR